MIEAGDHLWRGRFRLVAFLIGFCTLGFSWLVFPFLANGQHRDHLLRQGYLTREQVDARAVALT